MTLRLRKVPEWREVAKKVKKATPDTRRVGGKHQTTEVTLEKHENYNEKLTTILAGMRHPVLDAHELWLMASSSTCRAGPD